MKSWFRFVILLAVVSALAIVPSPAADPKKPEVTKQEQEDQAADVDLLTEAYKLAEFAQKHKSPESYIAAGAMILKLKAMTKGELGSLDIVPEVLDQDSKTIKNDDAKAKKAESLSEIANGFFESASALGIESKTSKEVEALIKAAKARDYLNGEATRGAIGGPKLVIRGIGPRQTHVYTIPFDTYSIAAIGFQASGVIQCKMQIGNYVHFDQHVSIGQYVWKPNANVAIRRFTITVHNNSNYPVTYKLYTN